MIQKDRLNPHYCPCGSDHLCGCGCGTTLDQVARAHALVASGATHGEAARLMGVSREYVSVLHRKPPRYVKGHYRLTAEQYAKQRETHRLRRESRKRSHERYVVEEALLRTVEGDLRWVSHPTYFTYVTVGLLVPELLRACVQEQDLRRSVDASLWDLPWRHYSSAQTAEWGRQDAWQLELWHRWRDLAPRRSPFDRLTDEETAHCSKCDQDRTFKYYATAQRRLSWTCTACGHHVHPSAWTSSRSWHDEERQSRRLVLKQLRQARQLRQQARAQAQARTREQRELAQKAREEQRDEQRWIRLAVAEQRRLMARRARLQRELQRRIHVEERHSTMIFPRALSLDVVLSSDASDGGAKTGHDINGGNRLEIPPADTPFDHLQRETLWAIIGDTDLDHCSEHELARIRDRVLEAGLAPPSVQRKERERLADPNRHAGASVPKQVGKPGRKRTRREQQQVTRDHHVRELTNAQKQADAARRRRRKLNGPGQEELRW